MTIRWIIKDIIYQGYWSTKDNSFKGIIFASQYISEEDAKAIIISSLPKGRYEIVKIYIKE